MLDCARRALFYSDKYRRKLYDEAEHTFDDLREPVQPSAALMT